MTLWERVSSVYLSHSPLLQWWHKPWPWVTFVRNRAFYMTEPNVLCLQLSLYWESVYIDLKERRKKRKGLEKEESVLSCICKQDKHNQHLESHICLWSSREWTPDRGARQAPLFPQSSSISQKKNRRVHMYKIVVVFHKSLDTNGMKSTSTSQVQTLITCFYCNPHVMYGKVFMAVGKDDIVVLISCSFRYLYQVVLSLFGFRDHWCYRHRCNQRELSTSFTCYGSFFWEKDWCLSAWFIHWLRCSKLLVISVFIFNRKRSWAKYFVFWFYDSHLFTTTCAWISDEKWGLIKNSWGIGGGSLDRMYHLVD